MGDNAELPPHQISKSMDFPAVVPVQSYMEQLKEL